MHFKNQLIIKKLVQILQNLQKAKRIQDAEYRMQNTGCRLQNAFKVAYKGGGGGGGRGLFTRRKMIIMTAFPQSFHTVESL